MRKRLLGAVTAALVLAVAVPAQASSLADAYGIGVRAMSMGGAFTAVADDYAAAYYNPAGLAQNTGFHVHLEMAYANPEFEVKYLDGADVLVYDDRGFVRNDPSDSLDGEGMDFSFPLIGGVLDINKVAGPIVDLPVNVQMGLAVSIPDMMKHAWMASVMAPDQPYMMRYGDDTEHVQLNIGFGVEALEDLLYIGFGGLMGVSTPGDVHVNSIVPGAGETNQKLIAQLDLAAEAAFGGELGVLVTPWDGQIRLGASWCDEFMLDVGPLPVEAAVDLFGSLNMVMPVAVHFISGYTPQEIGVGFAFCPKPETVRGWLPEKLAEHVPGDRPFIISLDAKYQKWSDFVYSDGWKPHYKQENDAIKNLYEPGCPDFDDVINYAVGVELPVSDALCLRGGYQFRPTPVPDQSGRHSNYIDMDKNVFSGGFGYNLEGWADKIGFIKSLPIEISGMVQYHSCEDYTVNKPAGAEGITWVVDSNNARGVESYTVDGDALVLGFGLEISL